MVQPVSSLNAPARPIRPRRTLTPSIILVGASTGGPQAMVVLIGGLVSVLARLPICVTLHLPSDLMPIIASHVARVCNVATEVVDSDRGLEPGVVYFAPGNKHLTFAREGAAVRVGLVPGTQRDLCKPAVDVMFKSAALSHGARALGVVLSGMGKDGLDGARAIVAAGGSVLVQDKESSAVWGMPGAIAKADLASAVLEPAAMAREIIARVTHLDMSA